MARPGQPFGNPMTQGPNWLEIAKQLCVAQPLQGLTINVHYHGASPPGPVANHHMQGLNT